jgi:hypothetical protein
MELRESAPSSDNILEDFHRPFERLSAFQLNIPDAHMRP